MFAAPGPPTAYSPDISWAIDCDLDSGICCCGSDLSCFGEESMVVGAVVAVLGRSLCSTGSAAAPEVEGSLPVSSSFLMRDFRSLSSSHTVSAVSEATEAESGLEGLGSEFPVGYWKESGQL